LGAFFVAAIGILYRPQRAMSSGKSLPTEGSGCLVENFFGKFFRKIFSLLKSIEGTIKKNTEKNAEKNTEKNTEKNADPLSPTR